MESFSLQRSGRNVWNQIHSTLEDMFGLDLRSLAVFRMAIAAVFIGDLIIRCTDLGMFYTDAGVLPRASLLAKPPTSWHISIHLMNGSPFFQAMLFIASGVAAIGLLVGFHTRWMTCLCWFMASSLHARNFLVCQGGDDYLRLLLFWSMFLPLGARYSIDSRLNSSHQPLPVCLLSWGSFALTIQTVILYVSTALFKSRGESWWDGTALYYALSLDCFAKRPAFLLLLFPGLLSFLSRAVFAFESLGWILLISPVWNGPLRTLGVFGFIGFHFGIYLTMAIGPFQWVSMAAVLAFLPPWFWERASPLFQGVVTRCKKKGERLLDALDAILTRLPRKALSIRPSRWSEAVVLVALAFVGSWVLSTLYPGQYRQPLWVQEICFTLNLKQGWAMFSPNVTRRSGWFVIPGKLANGEIVDLNRDGAPLSWAPPELVSAYFKNERQRKFLMNMRAGKFKNYQTDYSRYLCRSWNGAHSGAQRLASLELVFVDREILEGYRTTTYNRTALWEAYCSVEDRAFGPPLPHLAATRKGVPTKNFIPERMSLMSPYSP